VLAGVDLAIAAAAVLAALLLVERELGDQRRAIAAAVDLAIAAAAVLAALLLVERELGDQRRAIAAAVELRTIAAAVLAALLLVERELGDQHRFSQRASPSRELRRTGVTRLGARDVLLPRSLRQALVRARARW
jgi:hypothetical protein